MSAPLKNQAATISTMARTKGLSRETRDKTVHLYKTGKSKSTIGKQPGGG